MSELFGDREQEGFIPLSHQLSQQAHGRLKAFCGVFNTQLEIATGLNLTVWKHSRPSTDAYLQNAFTYEKQAAFLKEKKWGRRVCAQCSDISNGTLGNNMVPLLPSAWYEDSEVPEGHTTMSQSYGFKLLWWLAGMSSTTDSSRSNVYELSKVTDLSEEVPKSVIGSLKGGGWKRHMGNMIEAFFPKGLVKLINIFDDSLIQPCFC